MMAIKNWFYNRLYRGVSTAPLVAFRLIFGALVLFSTIRFIANGWVNQLYIEPQFFFPYYGFEWVKPLPGNWMYLPFVFMIIGALGILLGAFYRFSSTLFFLAFTYVELLDKTNYLNHYYFVSIIAFLIIWLPAHVDFSIDALRKPSIYRTEIPNWTVFILQFQLGIVYFCAGLAKINADWLLEAQPLKIWLQAFRDTPLIGNLFASSWLAFVFSWFGCFYDLSIPFLLSFRKTRTIAYVLVIIFHVLTWILFPIGVFPWAMIFTTLIFFPADFHQKWLTPLKKSVRWKPKILHIEPIFVSKQLVLGLSLFFAIQLIVPFRYLLYPGNLYWHEEGYRFSWRVMLMEKKASATFYVIDKKSGGEIEIDNNDYLTPTQIDQMSRQPDMILQFAHFLGNKFKDTTFVFPSKTVHLDHPKIGAVVEVALNGRPHKRFINKDIDLMNESYNLKHRTWIQPFTE